MKTTGSRKTRVRLTRERIIDAAIEIARKQGAQSVTMGNVSKLLGTTAMALYRHVDNHEDLVQSMLDRAAHGIDVLPLSDDPTEEILRASCALYDKLRLEPWVVHHLLEGYRGGAGAFALGNRMLKAFEGLGLDRAEVFHAYCAIIHYTYGEVLALKSFQIMDIRYNVALAPINEDEVALREFESVAAIEDPRALFAQTVRRYILGVIEGIRTTRSRSNDR